MAILNPKVKRSRNKTLILNSIGIFVAVLFLIACENREKKSDKTLLTNVIEKDTVLNSVKVKIKTYYRFNHDLTSQVRQAEEYIIADKTAFSISFSEAGVNWKDLDIKDLRAFQKCFPLFENRLGFELFMSNCLPCHTNYPNASDKGICRMLVNVKTKGSLQDFLRNSITDSLGTIKHQSFQYLDSLEIGNIHAFIEKSCRGSVTNTKE